MAKNKKLAASPRNISVAGASAFRDEHSLFEFDGLKEVEVIFELRRKQYIEIDREILEKLFVQATQLKTSPKSLLETWISKKAGNTASLSFSSCDLRKPSPSAVQGLAPVVRGSVMMNSVNLPSSVSTRISPRCF